MKETAKSLVAVRKRESNNLKEIIVVISAVEKIKEKIKELKKGSLLYKKIRKKLILLYDSLSFL